MSLRLALAETPRYARRTLAEVLAYDPEQDPNHRHLCWRCGAAFTDTATFGLCAEMGSAWGRYVGTLPLPFLRRTCGQCPDRPLRAPS